MILPPQVFSQGIVTYLKDLRTINFMLAFFIESSFYCFFVAGNTFYKEPKHE